MNFPKRRNESRDPNQVLLETPQPIIETKGFKWDDESFLKFLDQVKNLYKIGKKFHLFFKRLFQMNGKEI
jgi:hypothetical protein